MNSFLITFVLFIGCGEGNKSHSEKNTTSSGEKKQLKNQQSTSPGKLKTANQFTPPQQKKIAGLSKFEDLRSSWKESLGVSFELAKKSDITQCGDKDGDGFGDVFTCPWLSSEKADCDDDNSDVTPLNEIWVPASPFLMGSESEHAGRDEKPVHVVFMDGYCLDAHEVRVEDFAQFIRDANRKTVGLDLRSMSASGVVESGRKNHPIEGVTFEEASDYCQSLKKRLPTEAEFEKATRGGCELGSNAQKCDSDDLRAYPWGNAAPTCQLANHQLSTEGFPRLCVSDTVEVAESKSQKGPYGHEHLSGNVWEYALDYWHPKVYESQTDRKNPAGVKSGNIHVLRGGGWNTFSTNMRAANRFHDLVIGSASGFRCVRSNVDLQYDDLEPLTMVYFTGEIRAGELQELKGRAMYVSVFDAGDADDKGMVAPGRSPVAEVRLTPNNQSTQKFKLEVPKGSTYFISAALDGGGGAKKDDYVSASGSGGFGRVEKEISGSKDIEDLIITLQKPPQMPMKNPNMNPSKNHRPSNHKQPMKKR